MQHDSISQDTGTVPNGASQSRRAWLLALSGLGVLTLAMFGDVLFTSGDRVLSSPGLDLSRQFIHWRAFGFGELRHGHLALWSPHVFSGAPFFGGFQSALLYPPNVLFLILPVARAVNWSIALHVFLAGAFTYAWTARRGLHPWGCFLAAAIFMFCGAHFLHIYAGHLPNLCALAWVPLLFLAIDGLFEQPSFGWSLLGMFALAMQILAGHPQYVFYTGVAAAGYCAMCCFKAPKRKHFLLGLIAVAAGGVGLAAIQLLTGLQESAEALRSSGLAYGVASGFSFPPENLLTLVAPDFFGDMIHRPYWGRGYLWEMSFFVSLTGLVLAVVGAVWAERRLTRFSVIMVAALVVLALGSHTPLFKLLYHWVPGFDKFRGSSKFLFLASLFLALLAGAGLDALIKRDRIPRMFGLAVLIAAILLAGAAVALRPAVLKDRSDRTWNSLLTKVLETRESYLPEQAYTDQAFVQKAGKGASNSLLIASGILLVLAPLVILTSRIRKFASTILVLAVVELFVFARSSRETFDLARTEAKAVKDHLARNPGDYRILNLINPNAALSMGAQDIWGEDPGVLKRYAELLAVTQGVDPDQAPQYLPFTHDHPLYSILRRRFSFIPRGRTPDAVTIYSNTNSLGRLELIRHFRVITNRTDIFTALTSPGFNPREEVILESAPVPEPSPESALAEVKLLDSSTDHLTIEANLPTPAILLVTDAYSKNWKARALPGSSQSDYQIKPADYCLRSVSLPAGIHRFRMEYRPTGFIIGKWISIASVVVFLGLVSVCLFKLRSGQTVNR